MATKRNAGKKAAGSKKLRRAKNIKSVKPLALYMKYSSVD